MTASQTKAINEAIAVQHAIEGVLQSVMDRGAIPREIGKAFIKQSRSVRAKLEHSKED